MERPGLILVILLGLAAPGEAQTSHLVAPGPDRTLRYSADEQGNVIPDFSHCGFRGGLAELPDVATKITLSPGPGDDTERIQQAIDQAQELPWGPDGFRGAVLLTKGTYRIGGTLRITKSGIVLRGEGASNAGTVLLATGEKKRSLIEVEGADRPRPETATRVAIAADYVPVGATTFGVASPDMFKAGDTVLVERYGNADWIAAIGMDKIAQSTKGDTVQWKPFTLTFDRVVTAVDGDRITLDAPIVCAIEERWGGGAVVKYSEDRRLEKVGIENLLCRSVFDRKVIARHQGQAYFADERHAWVAVHLNKLRNGWVRGLTAEHFGMGCVELIHCKWVTVQDCRCVNMVSRVEGGRRYSFHINSGSTLCLVRDCVARGGRHDFVVGAWVTGPNVFLDCTSEHPLDSSEPHHRWSVGGLYDNVQAPIHLQDRWNWGTGHGWSGANYVLWNCRGPFICQKPPTAQNYAIGQVGPKAKPYQTRAEGHIESQGTPVAPRSLYLKQLEDRAASSGTASKVE